MYLRSLKLAGFKSFANRTRLEFEPGVSVVVGPNGTGKSNIVDAVAWVLGSQFTRALRTDRMDDVIFAGTATRARHARAEVTVVLDNADRLLPLELDEVSLTRRLFRGGPSEYEINGVSCRLLDVQELLSDGGMGRHQHLIVGQGRLDSLLSANGDHRRRIIEEAAGILKHQVRKARAIRRLEATDRDVLRLQDVVRELRRRRRPLRRQAAAAERYETVKSELRSLRLWLGGENLRTSRHRLQELAGERDGLALAVDARQGELGELEAAIAALDFDRTRAAADLELATEASARLETVVARLRGVSHVARERVGGLSVRIEAAREYRSNMQDEARRLAIRLAEAIEQEEKARQAVGSAQADFDALADRLRSLPDGEPVPGEAEPAAMRAEIQTTEAAIREDVDEQENLERLLHDGRERIVRYSASLETLENELRATADRLAVSRQVADDAGVTRAGLESSWEGAARTLRSASVGRMTAEAKVQAFDEIEGARRVPGREVFESRDGVVGVLARILEVPSRFIPAVEAAVGVWAEGLVLEGVEAVRGAFARIETGGRGRFPLLHRDAPLGESTSGAVAPASGVKALVDVLGPAADRRLASYLLGDVVLVDGWDTGLEIVRAHPEVRAVTRAGDLITSFGICPANPERPSPGLVEAAGRELEAARAVEAAAARSESESSSELAEARRTEDAARTELAALRADRTRISAELERVHRSRASSEREQVRLAERLDTVRRAAGERRRRLQDLTEKMTFFRDGPEGQRQARQRLRAQRASVEDRHRIAGLARDDAMRSLGAATERRRFLHTRSENVKAELGRLSDTVAESTELSHARSVRRRTRRVIEVVASKLGELAVDREVLEERVAALDQDRGEAGRKGSELERSIEKLRSRLSEVAVEETELRIREEALLEGLRRDAGATEEEALVADLPPIENGDPEARAASLSAELARLGPVNPLATAEFRELDDRYRVISEQLADLERARVELGKVIAVLDDEMETRFWRTFEDAARHYRRFFATLFPGGTGRLTLTNPEAPLEGGVDIEAQPLGKKLGNLALLSGGERSLAALAFLFAVFKARPGPFYLLDEVDAALDDANLQRFLRLLDEFRDHGQLIVVTHQQATVRAADILYGVTMEPGGSSRALTRRMDEASAIA